MLMYGNNKPMSEIQRVIVETDEKNPKVIAEITANNFDMADGFRIRIQPVYHN